MAKIIVLCLSLSTKQSKIIKWNRNKFVRYLGDRDLAGCCFFYIFSLIAKLLGVVCFCLAQPISVFQQQYFCFLAFQSIEIHHQKTKFKSFFKICRTLYSNLTTCFRWHSFLESKWNEILKRLIKIMSFSSTTIVWKMFV